VRILSDEKRYWPIEERDWPIEEREFFCEKRGRTNEIINKKLKRNC
jgi:hypothetical protein